MIKINREIEKKEKLITIRIKIDKPIFSYDLQRELEKKLKTNLKIIHISIFKDETYITFEKEKWTKEN